MPLRTLAPLSWIRIGLLLVLLAPAGPSALAEEKKELTETQARLLEMAKYLADDQRQGRGIGTKGLDEAADYIAGQFRRFGLKTDLVDGGPFQKFTLLNSVRPGKNNRAVLLGPQGLKLPLQMDQDYRPLALGGTYQGKEPLPLVFVGYGITAPDLGYDDYQGVDVKGKVVIVLRKEPQQNNPHSKFNGTRTTQHALFTRKVSNAFQHGAAGVILVNDRFSILQQNRRLFQRWQDQLKAAAEAEKKLDQARKQGDLEQLQKLAAASAQRATSLRQAADQVLRRGLDPLLEFRVGGGGSGSRSLPVICIRRKHVDRILRDALGKSLQQIEQEIDQSLKPQSQPLEGWRMELATDIQRRRVEVKNVLALLPGEGPLADEVVVLGAHYDHLGLGGPGSLAPGVRQVHNGADDNASGTTVLLEVARRLAQQGPQKRSILFIAFTAEERGLIGSAYYVNHPVLPLKNTVAMINLDMVGRLNKNRLILQGVDTAKEFDALIKRLNEKYRFDIARRPGGQGPSDHTSFYLKGVPVLHFFTGLHRDYHRPSDDYDKLNLEGMSRIADMVTDLMLELANGPQRPTLVRVKTRPRPRRPRGVRPYFGSIPDFASEGPGYRLMGVAEGSPAAKAGLRGGDVILQLGKYKVENLEDFDGALRKYKAGQKVPVKVRRGRQTLTLEVTLGEPR